MFDCVLINVVPECIGVLSAKLQNCVLLVLAFSAHYEVNLVMPRYRALPLTFTDPASVFVNDRSVSLSLVRQIRLGQTSNRVQSCQGRRYLGGSVVEWI